MSSRQEKDTLFQDIYRSVEDAFQADGREAAWYMPYGHLFSDAFRRRSRKLKRLVFAPQQEFCMTSEVTIDDSVFEITREWLTRSQNLANPPRANEGLFAEEGEERSYDEPEEDIETSFATTNTIDPFDSDAREALRDTHRVPDFVGFFRKANSKRELNEASALPWMIVEVKPHPVLLSNGQFAADDFGVDVKTYAHTKMCATRQQVLNQLEYAFHEYRSSITKLAVVIAVGPFFEFFLANRPSDSERAAGQMVELKSLETGTVFDDALSIDAKSLFSDDLKMINPRFYELFNLACREFGL